MVSYTVDKLCDGELDCFRIKELTTFLCNFLNFEPVFW